MSEWTDERPKTFGDCADKPDPCPWISCRYHMLLDINPRTGSLLFNVGAVRTMKNGPGHRGNGYRTRATLPVISAKHMLGRQEKTKVAQDKLDDRVIDLLQEQEHTCVLKVVDKAGGHLTLDAIGEVLCLTRERIRQIQTSAEKKIRQEPGAFAEV